MSKPTVTLAPVKPVLLIKDVCELLGVSESQFHVLTPRLKAMGLLQPVLPALDSRTRYRGSALVEWLSDKRQEQELEALLRKVG